MKIAKVLFFFLMLIGCSKDQSLIVSKETLRVNLGAEPLTLDPRKARALNAINICRVFFEGLTRMSKEGKPELALAEKMEVSPDGKRYMFTLREAFWSNGDRVSSEDFVYSWKTILDPLFPSPLAEQLYLIKGGKAAKEGKIPLDAIGISAPDEKTLLVELEHATPYFLEVLSAPISFPVPRKAEEKKKRWSLEPKEFVCNGPFCLKEWKHQDFLQVVKNSTYWDEKNVKLSSIFFVMVSPEVELSLFESGELDWAGSPFSTLPLDALKKWKNNPLFSTALYTGTIFLRINTEDECAGKILGQSSFRNALSSSIDRSFMVQHLLPGGQIPTSSLVPSSLLPSRKMQSAPSPCSLLQKALQEVGGKEEVPPLKLIYVSQECNHLIAQALQRQWKEVLGLKIILQAVESKFFYDMLAKGEYQMAISSWFADVNDPINFLELFKYKEGRCNHTFWQNEKYALLLDQSDLTVDRDVRKKLLEQAHELLMEEMPIIPIYQASLCYLKKKEVEGIYVFPLGYIDFKWACKR